MTEQRDTGDPARTHNLTRATVAAATLDVIDRLGVQAATMRVVADQLGVKAQSLYTHIYNREDLLDAVADLIINEADADLSMRCDPTDPPGSAQRPIRDRPERRRGPY